MSAPITGRGVPRRAPTAWVSALLALLLMGAPPVRAQEEIPVTLRARRFQYDRTTRLLVATGNVVVTYQDVTIFAGRLQANLATYDVVAEEEITIEVGGHQVRGAALEYNLLTRQGRIVQAAAAYRGPLVLGTVHLRAALVQGVVGGPSVARGAFCTTCEGPSPVAYLTADEFQVIPGDRIVGRRVAVWIGGRRILTWPTFIIFLREPQASRLFPVVGHSSLEGYYLKTFYTYSLNPDQHGYLRADLMERLGVGYGVQHMYRFPSASGTAFVYRLENKQTAGADMRLLLNHQQRLGDVNTRLYTDYIARLAPFVSATEAFLSLDATYRGPTFSTTLYQNFGHRDVGGFASRTYTARVIHAQNLAPRLVGEVVADFSRHSSLLGTDDELFPRLTLRYRGAGYRASLVAEGRLDLDGDRFLADVRSTTERLPELTVDADARILGRTRLVYQVQGGLGRFRETRPTGSTEAVRTDVGLTLSGPLLESTQGFLNLRALLRGSYYTTGDTRAFVSGRADFVRFVGDAWTMQAGLTYQDQAGQTPFAFDRLSGRIARAEATATYRRPNLVVTGTTSFDAVGGLWDPAIIRAQYAPRPDWVVASAAAYDPRLGRLTRAELAFDVRLNPRWQFTYYGSYNGLSGQVIHDNLAITRIWEDCLATALKYQGASREIWFEVWLTALPWARGRVGVGSQGNILFDQPWLTPRP